MTPKLAALIDCCRETKKSQFKIKESRFKNEIRKKEITQNEFQTIQKKKRKIGWTRYKLVMLEKKGRWTENGWQITGIIYSPWRSAETWNSACTGFMRSISYRRNRLVNRKTAIVVKMTLHVGTRSELRKLFVRRCGLSCDTHGRVTIRPRVIR